MANEKKHSRREVIKKASGALGVGGALTVFGTKRAKAQDQSSEIVVHGRNDGKNRYRIVVKWGNAYGGEGHDNIDRSGNRSVIEGHVYGGKEDHYQYYDNNFDNGGHIRVARVYDGAISINHDPEEATPRLRQNGIEISGHGSYKINTNYGREDCLDGSEVQQTCSGPTPIGQEPSDYWDYKWHYSVISGGVAGGNDAYTVKGDKTYIRLDGNNVGFD